MWNDAESYLQWLHIAYEQFKAARFVYDKKQTRIFYNKLYWDRRFKEEIKRMELAAEVQRRLKVECEEAA